MSHLNHLNLKKNNKFFRIKDETTGLYYSNYSYVGTDLGDFGMRKQYKLTFDEVGRFFNSERGARQTISMLTDKSYTEYKRMSEAEKVLMGAVEHSKLRIVRCTLAIRDLKT